MAYQNLWVRSKIQALITQIYNIYIQKKLFFVFFK